MLDNRVDSISELNMLFSESYLSLILVVEHISCLLPFYNTAVDGVNDTLLPLCDGYPHVIMTNTLLNIIDHVRHKNLCLAKINWLSLIGERAKRARRYFVMFMKARDYIYIRTSDSTTLARASALRMKFKS